MQSLFALVFRHKSDFTTTSSCDVNSVFMWIFIWTFVLINSKSHILKYFLTRDFVCRRDEQNGEREHAFLRRDIDFAVVLFHDVFY